MNQAKRSFTVGLVAFLLLAARLLNGQVATLHQNYFPYTDGPVNALLATNGIVYVGGAFSNVLHEIGRHGFEFSLQGGASVRPFPELLPNEPADSFLPIPQPFGFLGEAGITFAVPDDSGGWFLVGNFTHIGGLLRQGVAHLRSNGIIDSDWAPNTSTQAINPSEILTIVKSGNRLFLGGRFTSFGGKTNSYLVSIDASTGAMLDWNPRLNGPVSAMAVSENILYIGGQFSKAGDQDRTNTAALNLNDGSVTDWHPSITAAQGLTEIRSILPIGDTVYIGGFFTHAAGIPKRNLAAVDHMGGSVREWSASTNIHVVSALASHGDKLFVGGASLMQVDVNSGTAELLTPEITGVVTALGVHSNALYIATDEAKRPLKIYDFEQKSIRQAHSTFFMGPIHTLAFQNDQVFVGGRFSASKPTLRKNAAAIEAETGKITEWNPEASGPVEALAYANNQVYLGGLFENVKGEPRSLAASVDASSGNVMIWNPRVTGTRVFSLAATKDVVAIGGEFTHVGEIARTNLALVDVEAGMPLLWQPTATLGQSLATDGHRIYAAGSGLVLIIDPVGHSSEFQHFNLTSLPNTPSGEHTVFINKNKLYGCFATIDIRIGGVIKTFVIYSYDLAKKKLIRFDSLGLVGSNITAFAVLGEHIYIGGKFTRVLGSGVSNLAVFEKESGSFVHWEALSRSVGTSLKALASTDRMLFAALDLPLSIRRFVFPSHHRVDFQRSEPGMTSLRLSGIPTETYMLEASANLTDWMPVATNKGTFHYEERQSHPQKFYRGVLRN